MNPGIFEALLGRVATGIGDLARGLKGRLSRWLRGRRRAKNPEIAEQLRAFDRPYLELLSHALKDVTGQEIDPSDLRRMSIGDVSLSQRLYRQHVATAARVRQILAEHTKYAHDSRKLALDLYEGYGFREREVLVPKVRLPKYLEQARLNREMDALLARLQAAKLKTPALRAGYLQMLDAILGDAGQEAIDNALNVAVQERYRYFANRIAQTELARAQTDEVARELMADETVQVVRHRLSGGHVPDLCDVFTRADRYGLGPGLYPKALAPKPPHHPHCRCTLSAELFKSAAGARFDPAADAAYLRTLDPKTAARVAGSRAKREEILMGANAEALWNAKRPEGYRIGRVGDVILKDVKPSAYEIAKSGGRHAGFLKDQAAKSDGELARSIRSLRSQVETHRDKIANPSNWVMPGITPQHLNGLVNSYWPKEIANFTQQIEILESILLERKR